MGAERKQIPLRPFRDAFQASEQHLLAASCGRDQPDAHLHEPDVGFGSGADLRGVQTDLTPPAERQGKWGCHYRLLKKLERHINVLKGSNHQLDVIPVLILSLEEDGHQVRADAEMSSLVPENQG